MVIGGIHIRRKNRHGGARRDRRSGKMVSVMAGDTGSIIFVRCHLPEIPPVIQITD